MAVQKKIEASSALISEATTVRLACLVGMNRGLQGISICSDAKIVISLALSDLEPP